MVFHHIQAYHVEYRPLTLQTMSKPFVSVWGLACQCDYVHRCFHYPRASHRVKGTLSTKNVEIYISSTQNGPDIKSWYSVFDATFTNSVVHPASVFPIFYKLATKFNDIASLWQCRTGDTMNSRMSCTDFSSLRWWCESELSHCNSCALSPCMILLSLRINENIYSQTSSIRRIKSHKLIFCLILQLFLPNPLKPGVKSIIKM